MAKILCIDDDQDILSSLTATLESKGHKVETSVNAQDGLKKAEEIKPDLIILDVMMDKDTEGFHASYDIRKSDVLKYTPILMLTSVNEKTGFTFNPEYDGEFLPVDKFVEKPFTPNTLIEDVEKLLALPKEKINVSGKTQVMD